MSRPSPTTRPLLWLLGAAGVAVAWLVLLVAAVIVGGLLVFALVFLITLIVLPLAITCVTDGGWLLRMWRVTSGTCPGCGARPPDGLSPTRVCEACGVVLDYPPLRQIVTCGRCRYPLAGVRGTVCPECGCPLDPAHVAAQRRAGDESGA